VLVREIPDQEFIDHKVGDSRRGERRRSPRIGGLPCLKNTGNACCFSGGITDKVGIGCRIYKLIVGITNLVAVWIAYLYTAVNEVLEYIFPAGDEVCLLYTSDAADE